MGFALKLQPTVLLHGKPSKLRSSTNSQLQLVVAKDTQAILSTHTVISPSPGSEKEKSLLTFSISLEPKLLMLGVLLMLFIGSRMDIASSCKEPNLEMLQMMSISTKEPLLADPNF